MSFLLQYGPVLYSFRAQAKNFQQTVTKAASKSIAIIIPELAELFNCSITSYMSLLFSPMKRPLLQAVWPCETSCLITPFTLFATAVDMYNLKIDVQECNWPPSLRRVALS